MVAEDSETLLTNKGAGRVLTGRKMGADGVVSNGCCGGEVVGKTGSTNCTTSRASLSVEEVRGITFCLGVGES